MTLDDAAEAGMLATALGEVDDLLRHVGADDHEEYGIGLSYDHSDAGSSGFGDEAIVPRDMARRVVEFLRGEIVARLTALGVEASA